MNNRQAARQSAIDNIHRFAQSYQNHSAHPNPIRETLADGVRAAQQSSLIHKRSECEQGRTYPSYDQVSELEVEDERIGRCGCGLDVDLGDLGDQFPTIPELPELPNQN